LLDRLRILKVKVVVYQIKERVVQKVVLEDSRVEMVGIQQSIWYLRW
jgi:hypothetical protein